MLIAALVLAFVAFVAFVNYILSASDWSLYLLYGAAGAGLILFVLDWLSKRRRDRSACEQAEAYRSALAAGEENGIDSPEGELPDTGEIDLPQRGEY